MEHAFWLMWKTLPPILVLFVLVFAVLYRQQQRRADSLWRSILAYRREQNELVVKLAKAQLDAAEAQSIANILRHRDEATCPCSAVKAADERIAYLTERNSILTLYCLDNSAKLMSSLFRN